MSKFDLKEVMATNTVEGITDYEKVMQSVDQEYVNPIVTSKKPNVDKIKADYFSEIVGSIGVEAQNVDDLKGYFGDINKTDVRIKELEGLNNDWAGKFDTLNTELTSTKRLHKVTELGVKGESAEFLMYKLGKSVTEDKDFDTLLTEHREGNPDFYKNKSYSTNVQHRQEQQGGDSSFIDAYNKKYKK
jgi:hypothetical protein